MGIYRTKKTITIKWQLKQQQRFLDDAYNEIMRTKKKNKNQKQHKKLTSNDFFKIYYTWKNIKLMIKQKEIRVIHQNKTKKRGRLYLE